MSDKIASKSFTVEEQVMGRQLAFLLVTVFASLGIIVATRHSVSGSSSDRPTTRHPLVVVRQGATPTASDCGESWRFVIEADPAGSPTPAEPLASIETVIRNRILESSDFDWFPVRRSIVQQGDHIDVVIDDIFDDDQRALVLELLSEEAFLQLIDPLEQPLMPGGVVPDTEVFPQLAANEDLTAFTARTASNDLALGLRVDAAAGQRIAKRFADQSDGQIGVLIDHIVIDVLNVEIPLPTTFTVTGILAGDEAWIQLRVAQLRGGRLPVQVTARQEEVDPPSDCS